MYFRVEEFYEREIPRFKIIVHFIINYHYENSTEMNNQPFYAYFQATTYHKITNSNYRKKIYFNRHIHQK